MAFNARSRAFAAVVAVAAGAALAGLAAPAAQAQRRDQSASEPQRRGAPTIRIAVYDRLVEAQQCAEDDEFDCARRRLDEVRAMRNLSGYEAAQMWNVYAAFHLARDDYPQAITAFENVLQQEDLPLGIEQSTRYALAQLYGHRERYVEALDALERWFEVADMPSADAYMLKARYHYLLMQYHEGIEPAEAALRIALEQGKEPEEAWYQLLQVLYYELEDYPNVIRTATTLVERWPKKEHLVTLASLYGQQGEDIVQLALYETAYEAGWLDSGSELANLAQMLLQADVPYKAARILERGLEEGTVPSSETHWRLLAQAWVVAQEDEKALSPLTRASELSATGELDMRLANAYANLSRFEECVDSAGRALARAGFDRVDLAQMVLGNCLFSLNRYGEAKTAFRAAASDSRSRDAAQQWLLHTEIEEARERELQATLSALR
jgi:hypothetical protein